MNVMCGFSEKLGKWYKTYGYGDDNGVSRTLDHHGTDDFQRTVKVIVEEVW